MSTTKTPNSVELYQIAASFSDNCYMADIAEIRSRVRTALGDLGDRFSITLAGGQSSYQLGYRRVSDLVVHELSGSTVSEISPDGYELEAR